MIAPRLPAGARTPARTAPCAAAATGIGQRCTDTTTMAGPETRRARRCGSNRRIRVGGIAVLAFAVLALGGCSDNTDPTATTNASTASGPASASLPTGTGTTTGSAGPAPGTGSLQDPGSQPAPAIGTSPTTTGNSTAEGTGIDARAGYITAADAACDTAGHQLGAVTPANGPTELVATLKSQLQVQQDLLTTLSQLTPPAADGAEITARLIDPFQQAIAGQQALLPAIESAVSAAGDTVQLASLHTDYDTAGHPQSVAVFVRDYGFHTCQSFDYFRGQ